MSKIDIFQAMVTARLIDELERKFTMRGEAFFHVSGAGHEGVAALNDSLIEDDYLHLHYRDKSLMLARGIPPIQFFYSLFCKDASHSRGRQMSAHLCDRKRKILSLVGPVGNNALQAVGAAAAIRDQVSRPLLVCSMGEGASQQGEVLEAIAEAVRWQLPVLFLLEDNQYAISTKTKRGTFFDLPDGPVERYYGLPIHRVDGTDIPLCSKTFAEVVENIRKSRGPEIVHMKVERLCDHSNADDQARYRSEDEITKAAETFDPIEKFKKHLIDEGVNPVDLASLEQEILISLESDARLAQQSKDPVAIYTAKRPLTGTDRKEYLGDASKPRLSMLNAINEVLRYQLGSNANVTLYGQDIEDPKGDVFGVTAGLSTEFPGRVMNSSLTESTIIGTSIGRALTGGRPVAFLQFADFLPLAFNQIISELGSMYWRTDCQWQCPVIVMITCGGYRPGLGPFHAQSLEAIAAHTPGVDVVMPSTASDAAGMLQAAFDSQRPTLFFYPKSCLNRKTDLESTSKDVKTQWVPVGCARIEEHGDDLTLIAYGNTVELCRQASRELEKAGVSVNLIDLRWLSPWDQETVLDSVQRTRNAIVVHEDNLSCGVGAEIVATINERSTVPVRCRRIGRADTYVPCNFANQLEVLPSFKSILEAGCEVLGFDIHWEEPEHSKRGVYLVEATGSAPSDESVLILEWHIAVGDTIEPGQSIGTIEASKASFEFESPVGGIVEEILAQVHSEVPIGKPIVRVRLSEDSQSLIRQVTKPLDGRPVLERRAKEAVGSPGTNTLDRRASTQVGILGVSHALGAQTIENEALLKAHWKESAEDIARMTGISSRRRIDTHQDLVSLGAQASRQVLEQTGLSIQDIDLVICTTSTPDLLSPTVAYRVLYELAGAKFECPAYDLNAACAGYIYGLQTAYNELKTKPEHRILLVTSEVISVLLDPMDFTTAVIFGDAATATIVGGQSFAESFRYEYSSPFLSGSADDGRFLKVPHADSKECLSMDGMAVFNSGVRYMVKVLKQACEDESIGVDDLDLIIPHQANKRIIDVIVNRLSIDKDKAYSNIARVGNTSSSSIPICLSEVFAGGQDYKRIGLTAFGSGFACGATVLTSQGIKNDCLK